MQMTAVATNGDVRLGSVAWTEAPPAFWDAKMISLPHSCWSGRAGVSIALGWHLLALALTGALPVLVWPQGTHPLATAEDLMSEPWHHQPLPQWCPSKAGLQLPQPCPAKGPTEPWAHVPAWPQPVPICREVPDAWGCPILPGCSVPGCCWDRLCLPGPALRQGPSCGDQMPPSLGEPLGYPKTGRVSPATYI